MNELIPCYTVRWQEDGRWHFTHFAAEADALAYRLTLPDRGAFIVSTTAAKDDVIPAMVDG